MKSKAKKQTSALGNLQLQETFGKNISVGWESFGQLDEATRRLIQPKLPNLSVEGEYAWRIKNDGSVQFRQQNQKEVSDGIELGICMSQNTQDVRLNQFRFQQWTVKLGPTQRERCQHTFKRIIGAMGLASGGLDREKLKKAVKGYIDNTIEAAPLITCLNNLRQHPEELRTAAIAASFLSDGKAFLTKVMWALYKKFNERKFDLLGDFTFDAPDRQMIETARVNTSGHRVIKLSEGPLPPPGAPSPPPPPWSPLNESPSEAIIRLLTEEVQTEEKEEKGESVMDILSRAVEEKNLIPASELKNTVTLGGNEIFADEPIDLPREKSTGAPLLLVDFSTILDITASLTFYSGGNDFEIFIESTSTEYQEIPTRPERLKKATLAAYQLCIRRQFDEYGIMMDNFSENDFNEIAENRIAYKYNSTAGISKEMARRLGLNRDVNWFEFIKDFKFSGSHQDTAKGKYPIPYRIPNYDQPPTPRYDWRTERLESERPARERLASEVRQRRKERKRDEKSVSQPATQTEPRNVRENQNQPRGRRQNQPRRRGRESKVNLLPARRNLTSVPTGLSHLAISPRTRAANTEALQLARNLHQRLADRNAIVFDQPVIPSANVPSPVAIIPSPIQNIPTPVSIIPLTPPQLTPLSIVPIAPPPIQKRKLTALQRSRIEKKQKTPLTALSILQQSNNPLTPISVARTSLQASSPASIPLSSQQKSPESKSIFSPKPSESDSKLLEKKYELCEDKLEEIRRIVCSQNPAIAAVQGIVGCPDILQPPPKPQNTLLRKSFDIGFDTASES